MRDVTSGCKISIDKEGRWFYDKRQITHPAVLDTFYNSLQIDNQGRYKIVVGDEFCYVDVEDTPFIVKSVSKRHDGKYVIFLNSGKSEILDPHSLRIGKDNVLYARLSNGMEVRFSRQAYYSLALDMEQKENGDIVLYSGGRSYTIQPGREHLAE